VLLGFPQLLSKISTLCVLSFSRLRHNTWKILLTRDICIPATLMQCAVDMENCGRVCRVSKRIEVGEETNTALAESERGRC